MNLAHIRHGDAQPPLGGGRFERLGRVRQVGQQRQRLAHRPAHALGQGGGQHAPGRAHEKLVAEGLAQPAQRIAHGRLRQVQPARHGGDVALFEQMLEHHQQIEIQFAQFVHGGSIIHEIYSLYLYIPISTLGNFAQNRLSCGHLARHS